MLGPFLDTVVFCGATALVVVMSGAYKAGAGAETVAARAFSVFMPRFGGAAVNLTLVFLVYSTIISWAFYGERCVMYLFGKSWVMPYRAVYSALPLLCAGLPTAFLLDISDVAIALMALPNLAVTVILSGRVASALAADKDKPIHGQSSRIYPRGGPTEYRSARRKASAKPRRFSRRL